MRLVLLNDEGQIAEVLEESITKQEFVDIVEDHCRLIKIEKKFQEQSAISKSNEHKIHLLFQVLAEKGAFRNNKFSLYPLLKPYIDDVIMEHEHRKKLNNKLKQYMKEQNSLFWKKIGVLLMKGFSWVARAIGRKLKK